MNREFIAKHWYAYIYEQLENQTNDVEFFLEMLKQETTESQRILEVACGGGRISLPLAKAGHDVTGFDADEHMLLRFCNHIEGIPNVRCFNADAIKEDWGKDYDVVIVGGNLLINIETDGNYKDTQISFIQKAAQALHKGGHLLLDFQLLYDDSKFFNSLNESSYFEGTDDIGTYGKTYSYGSVYDPVTQICAGSNHTEIVISNGEKIVIPRVWHKHIPKLEQVYEWIEFAGLKVSKAYKNYNFEPLKLPIDEDNYRATIWAEKI